MNELKEIYKHYLSYKCALKSLYYKKDFEDIRIMVLTIGFNRSGSSLIGYLLTAHPNIVIADELEWTGTGIFNYESAHLYKIYDNTNLNKIFSFILDTDKTRYLHKKSYNSLYYTAQRKIHNFYYFNKHPHRSTRYILVPNQYQGRFKKLKVIGMKSSVTNNDVLLINNQLGELKRRFKERDIKLKFICTTRNPYDISASIQKANKWEDETISLYFMKKFCEKTEKIFGQINPQNIFIHRHEDMCKDPEQQLTKLCNFLEIPIPADYIEDCSSQVARKPSETRTQVNFSQEYKQEIASLIEKYDFLSGYINDPPP